MAGQRSKVQIGLSVLVLGLFLSGCTSTQDVLAPAAAVSTTAEPTSSPSVFAALIPTGAIAPPADPSPALALQQTASVLLTQPPASAARIAFTPIIGAPAGKLTTLTDRLRAQAPGRRLNFVKPENDATLTMRGYLSAIEDEGSITVIYVWDIADLSGERLHRIQGQESAPVETTAFADDTDLWPLVPAELMQRVADQTIESLIRWLPTTPQS